MSYPRPPAPQLTILKDVDPVIQDRRGRPPSRPLGGSGGGPAPSPAAGQLLPDGPQEGAGLPLLPSQGADLGGQGGPAVAGAAWGAGCIRSGTLRVGGEWLEIGGG